MSRDGRTAKKVGNNTISSEKGFKLGLMIHASFVIAVLNILKCDCRVKAPGGVWFTNDCRSQIEAFKKIRQIHSENIVIHEVK